jgi:hypothetical protein
MAIDMWRFHTYLETNRTDTSDFLLPPFSYKYLVCKPVQGHVESDICLLLRYFPHLVNFILQCNIQFLCLLLRYFPLPSVHHLDPCWLPNSSAQPSRPNNRIPGYLNRESAVAKDNPNTWLRETKPPPASTRVLCRRVRCAAAVSVCTAAPRPFFRIKGWSR